MPRDLCQVDLLGVGRHHSRQGVLVTGPDQLQHYIRAFHEMKQCGILIPMFWGHQMKRGGPIHSDDRATQRAMYTAGWVQDLRLHPSDHKKMQVIFPPPPGMSVNDETGCLENREKHTQIREVSAGIGDWKDGTGRWWEDVIVHVALTPLPVWLGQTGITVYDDCEKMIALSADGEVRVKYILGGVGMPAMMKPKKPGATPDDEAMPDLYDEAADGDETPSDADEGAASQPKIPDGSAAPSPAAEGDPNAAPNDMAGEPDGDEANPLDDAIAGEAEDLGVDEEMEPQTSPVVDMLAQMGIDLPEDTTTANLEDRLICVLGGLVAAGAVIHVGGEKDLGPMSKLDKATPEQAPLFTLSTDDPLLREENPLVRALANRAAEDAREVRRRRLNAVVAKGLPSHVVDRVRERVTTVHLSLDGELISTAMPDVDDRIELLEMLADEVAPLLRVKATLGDSNAAKSPIPNDMPTRDADSGRVKHDSYDRDFVQKAAERAYGSGVKVPESVGGRR
jgi:hypothetical protein